ncbi:hypothetical protein [Vibrio quintilis]|uniref:Lipoprotein n=1 Tax=Vibrio quintilis TaxID=1117707 RepID=A0A1M7YZI9_9VIBR|nr:hypothetical protein [Vibrio quintilis]SHO57856.1 hypothetical protein VQ7734_03626 [Vibrio quintilis]
MKNRLLRAALLAVAITATLSGCSGEATSFEVNDVSVSDFPYTMNSKPAVDITIKQDEHNFCSVTLLRSDIAQSFNATLEHKSTGRIGASCNIDGNTFILSSKHPTKASVLIDSLDKAGKQAKIHVSLKLVNVKTLKDYFILDDIEIHFSGKQVINLITMPK